MITLTALRIMGQIFCRTSFNLGLSDEKHGFYLAIHQPEFWFCSNQETRNINRALSHFCKEVSTLYTEFLQLSIILLSLVSLALKAVRSRGKNIGIRVIKTWLQILSSLLLTLIISKSFKFYEPQIILLKKNENRPLEPRFSSSGPLSRLEVCFPF